MQKGNTDGPRFQAALLVLLVSAAVLGDRIFGAGSTGTVPPLGQVPRPAGAAGAAHGAPSPSPDRWAPRELRHLPGIGEQRAQQIAEERWRRGGHFPLARWHELRGIGPLTQGEVAEVLRRRGIEARAGDPSPALLHSPR